MHDRLNAKSAVADPAPARARKRSTQGVIDLVEMKAYRYLDEDAGRRSTRSMEIPADLLDEAKHHRDEMIEKVAEAAHEAGDDDLMEKYVGGETPTVAEIKAGHPQGHHRDDAVPGHLRLAPSRTRACSRCWTRSSTTCPRRSTCPPTMANDPQDRRAGAAPSPRTTRPSRALVFKIMTDPFVGQLAFIRVYSGTMKTGDTVLNTTKGTKERIGRLLKMHANKREEIKEVYAGDIAAAVGLKNVTTGDTICDPQKPGRAGVDQLPGARHRAGRRAEDQERPGEARRRASAKLMQEDPTFKVETDQDTGQTKISGMGELHLEIIVDRLKREFGVEANVGKPQVAYKETIRKAAKGEGKYIKQTGGRGQYGHAKIELEPAPGEGFVFENDITGGSIPKEFIKPIEEGIKEALERGILAGYPVVDVRVRLYDGSYHDVDSSEMAFKIAGSMAFQDAAKKAQPGAARADHEGRGGDARRLHGRGHRRPVQRGAATSRARSRAAARRSSPPWCRSRTCSATRPTCARARRAAPPTRCTSRSTRRPRAT